MSRFTQGQLDGYLNLKVLPYFFTEQALLRMFKAKGLIKTAPGGKTVNWDVRLSAQTLKSYGKYATFTASEAGDYATAQLPWGAVFAADAVSGLEMEQQGEVGSVESGTKRKLRAQALEELKEDFLFRFNTQLWSGDGATLNGGSGATLYGVQQAVVTSPATGTYAGLNRATITDHQNQQFAATSGPSTDASADAWWAIMKMKTLCSNRPMAKGRAYAPDMLFVPRDVYVLLKNKGFAQNTAIPGVVVKSVETIDGMEFTLEDDLSAATAYMLSSEAWTLMLPPGRGKADMFRLHYKTNLPNHVNPNDEALVMDFHGQLACTFPKANGVITSFA